MKKERLKLYPTNWAFISADIRFNRACNRCENCLVENGQVYYTDKLGSRRKLEFEQLEQVQQVIDSTGQNEKRV